ncbi:serine hydrolase [Sphaerisporangium siamense]|uniref:D-alanyl-D-alanine carboxypeptidase n=1 Tax=Sphaerisporangium siamense TaxID=795645 RepID=A0A7W7D277_9ACTN|nr:serine hydrolase domain-containing protein [Sphaerisporangium siamense]MBB4698954.1 D-alanyl-D-alanine carboxypeptidase [Sphaerisporangium siamense]GII88521.1 serine hydrolase [Sphaerisporangium siamense]
MIPETHADEVDPLVSNAHRSPARAQTAPERTALQAALDAITAGGVPGALAEARDENGRWTGTSGSNDLHGTPVPPSGRWRVASITKTFVAALILQLTGEGKLRLDDPIARHLPGLLPRGGQITVRMLLNHTSGLADYAATWEDSPRGFRELATTTYTPQQLIDRGTALPPVSAPGGQWSYSNTGYIALGRLAEKITGQSLSHALRNRIFLRHGLSDTFLPTAERTIPGAHLNGHTTDENGHLEDITRSDTSHAWAAGAIISTAADLNRFYSLLMRGEIVPSALVTQMKRTVPGPDLAYGLGLMRLTLPCGKHVWGHTGHIPGYTTYSFHDDHRGLTIAANAMRSHNDTTTAQAITQLLATEFHTT